jgi:hypothetical protein
VPGPGRSGNIDQAKDIAELGNGFARYLLHALVVTDIAAKRQHYCAQVAYPLHHTLSHRRVNIVQGEFGATTGQGQRAKTAPKRFTSLHLDLYASAEYICSAPGILRICWYKVERRFPASRQEQEVHDRANRKAYCRAKQDKDIQLLDNFS